MITLLKRDNAHTITEGLELVQLVETYKASLKEPPKAKTFGKEISRIFNARGGSFHYSVAGAAKFFKADELRVDHVFMCCRHDDTNKHWSYLIIRTEKPVNEGRAETGQCSASNITNLEQHTRVAECSLPLVLQRLSSPAAFILVLNEDSLPTWATSDLTRGPG